MLDRASTFDNDEMIALLNEHFVPVAIDQAYERRQQDNEGELWRAIAGQGPRHDFRRTTQGFYVATPGGQLLLYNNNRDPQKVRRLVRQALAEFRASAAADTSVEAMDRGKVDARYAPEPPAGGLVVRVHGRVLAGYPEPKDDWERIKQSALSRDNLWLTRDEHEALVRGELPDSLVRRLARFHLVDATRGEPPMWRDEEVRALDVKLRDGRITGRVELATKTGDRRYEAALFGFVETDGKRVTRFDLIGLGPFRGEGRYTRGAPPGDFPLAVRFTIADGRDVADAIPPQGSRGWLPGYLR